MRHVDAYLMCASGFKPTRDAGPQTIGESAERFSLIMGDGMPPPRTHHRHLEPIVRRSRDVGIHRPPVRFRHSPNEGRVCPFKRPVATMVGKLFAQRMVGNIGFCGNQEAARIFVDAMDDPWPLDTADP